MRIFTFLDAIVGPLPEEVTKAVTESPDTLDSLGGIIIPALVLVAVAVIGIVLFSIKTKTE